MSEAIPTPGEVLAFLDRAAIELDELGKKLEAAHISLGDAEATWEEAKDVALLELVGEYEKEGKKLPGEDVRLALARKRTGFQAYADWVKAKRLVVAIERHVKRLETAVSARQSTLKTLRETGLEPRRPTDSSPQPQWRSA